MPNCYLDRAVVRGGVSIAEVTVQGLPNVVEGVTDAVVVEGGLKGAAEFALVSPAFGGGVGAERESGSAHQACVVTTDVRGMGGRHSSYLEEFAAQFLKPFHGDVFKIFSAILAAKRIKSEKS